MRQIRVGDITIDAVIEREGPWRRPQDFFPMYDEATFHKHLPGMEPEVFDAASKTAEIDEHDFMPGRTGRRQTTIAAEELGSLKALELGSLEA